MDLERTVEEISSASKEKFAERRAVLSFAEYLDLLVGRPYALTRSAGTYLRDLFEHYGSYEVPGIGGPIRRWCLFDDLGSAGTGQVFGQEEVQNRILEILVEFVERGHCDRFVLLHGPNGSAKSSIVEALRNGLESYSRSEDGPLFRLSWIFCEASERTSMGFGPESPLDKVSSFAHIDDHLISSRVPDEMKDPPYFLIPKQWRRKVLERALEEGSEEERGRFHWNDFVTKGDLSPKNKVIYESLLRSYEGDWQRVIRHIRVERYYLSHRYRTGAVTIEPQGTIDAGARLLGHGQMSGLPPVLSHETLYEANGDLVDANAGIVEYSDFFKRNMEANKYLLTTAERGYVNLSNMTIALNLVLLGTTNEKFLVAFKRDPTFTSFKGRFELVRVPYLREYRKEALIYQRHLDQVSGNRHVAPHTATCAALWAVLTRLRRPQVRLYQGALSRVVKNLTPIQKARLYDRGEIPPGLTEEEAKHLRQSIRILATESDGMEEEFEGFADAAYEGRRGASPREIMNLLTEIAVDCERDCITPVDVFEALPRLIADPSLYSFLRLEQDGEYHDPEGFIEQVRREYMKHVAGEIQKASDLVEEREYHRLFADYMQHVRAFGTREKVANRQTGKPENPDERLMAEVEERLDVLGNAAEFRGNLMSKIAAFRLSNPDRPIVYEELFMDYFDALERSYFSERRERVMSLVEDALAVHSGAGDQMVRDRRDAAKNLVARLIRDFGYTETSAGHILGYFQRHHADLEA
jgi:predicted Ser/Thr protein kinase